MKCLLSLELVLAIVLCLYTCRGTEQNNEDAHKWPTIGISMLIKNKAGALPYSLSGLQQLDYPKDRLYVWFYMDGSADESLAIVETWAKKYGSQYSKIYITGDKNKPADGARAGPTEWTEERLKHIIQLREKAVHFAKKRWADYIFMLDADVLLTEESTLKRLVRRNLPVVAPMLLSDGLYSNFWAAMSDKYYYERSDQYEDISNRETIGCFEVPMVHSAVLVDLRYRVSDLLTYDPANIKQYDGPIDDIIAFAISAQRNGIPMAVCNEEVFGFIPVPLDMNHTGGKTSDSEQLLNVKMEALAMGISIPLDPLLRNFLVYPPRDRLGVDRVFWINLERRGERRRVMESSFRELGVEAQLVKAVDGRLLNMQELTEYGVTLMPNYEDPFHKRPMKAGEVGCFLSHFKIWKEIAARHIPRSLVLEDDVKFTPFFRRRLRDLLRDLDSLPDWDLVYIGRKILQSEREERISSLLVKPRYSYWTLGYLISERGARKLIRAEPCARILPVDEFLPIMFDQHPNETWKSFFPRRNLNAYSASPLLVDPTHYTGEPGYVSDTEESHVLAASESPGASDDAVKESL